MWPWIRAGLITAAMIIGLLDGCPVPQGRHFSKLDSTAQRAIVAIDRTRTRALAPFRPIADVTQIRQRWQLFQGASHRRFQLRVEGAAGPPDAPWRLLFRAGDPAHQRYADILHYRRMRGSWNPSGQNLRGSYHRFSQWLLARVLADYPELDRARVVFERIAISDGGGYTPTGELAFPVVRSRPAPTRTPTPPRGPR